MKPLKLGMTGATGFLGSILCRMLTEDGHTVVPFSSANLDIRREVTLPPLDGLYHLAANSHVYWARSQPLEDFHINALGTLHVLEAARKAKIPRFVYASTALVYEDSRYTAEEDRVGWNAQVGPYGLSKLAGEGYVRQYGKSEGIEYVILRPSSLYGPGMRKNPIYDLVQALLKNEKARLFVTADSSYDFVYGEDAARAFLMGLGWKEEVLNLGHGEAISITDLAHLLGKIAGRPAEFIPGERQERYCVDNARIMGRGWKEAHNLAEGLRLTLSSFPATKAREQNPPKETLRSSPRG